MFRILQASLPFPVRICFMPSPIIRPDYHAVVLIVKSCPFSSCIAIAFHNMQDSPAESSTMHVRLRPVQAPQVIYTRIILVSLNFPFLSVFPNVCYAPWSSQSFQLEV